MDHFIIGGYKTCIMSNTTVYLRLIGMTYVKKHEKNVDYRKRHITLYWTGTEPGSTGTTMLLLAGKIPRRDLNPNFFIKYGVALLSGIIMADTA